MFKKEKILSQIMKNNTIKISENKLKKKINLSYQK